MILNYGKVISKEELTVKIWGYDADIEYNSIEVYISFLRKSLVLSIEVNISTVRGLGYTIKGERMNKEIKYLRKKFLFYLQ